MTVLAYVSVASSTLFRIAAYAFLRVIPSRLLLKIMTASYAAHLSSLYFLSFSANEEGKTSGNNHEPSSANGHSDSPAWKNEKPRESRREEASLMEALRTIVLSIPSPVQALTRATLILNTALWILAADMVLYPYYDNASDVIFTRVGAVYPDSARLVVRYPHANATDATLRVLWRQAALGEETWTSGPVVNLTSERDWVNTVPLGGLWPNTQYEYILGDADGNKLDYPSKPVQFHTFPDPRLPSGSHFRFIASSCTTPNFPYLPFNGRRIKGFDLLAEYLWPSRTLSPTVLNATLDALNASDVSAGPKSALEKYLPQDLEPAAEFMIFLGDFIYADVPYYYGDDAEQYRRLYRRNYQSQSFRQIYENLPIFHTYDDHEIINNYMGQSNDSKAPFANADDAFRLYNADANYPGPDEGQHYYNFRYADAAFFVMDTRRYRSDINQEDPLARTMLGDKQLSALYDWLGRVNTTATFKFIVSSVPFTSLWQHDAQIDSWAAYPYEKTTLLKALHSVANVIVISGDRHEFAAIKFNGEGDSNSVLEVSTSPLSMFYVPFVRTLKMTSDAKVTKKKEVTEVIEGQTETTLLREEVPQEEVLKYIAQGNYKWSSFEVDTRDVQHPKVKLEVMIDGVPAYRLEIAGRPVELRPTAALANIVPSGIMSILDKMGLTPARWF